MPPQNSPSKVVEIPGVGNVEFPGDMADDAISHVAQQQFSLANNKNPTSFEKQNIPASSIFSPINPGAGTNPVTRFLSSAAGAALSAPKALYDTVRHPIDTLTGINKTVNDAIDTYANPATRPTWEGIKSVLPEALGGGAGTVAAGEMAKLPGVASDALDINNKAATALRSPATARQSQLGKPGTVKDILPSSMQKWAVPDWAIPKGDVGTPTNPGPYMEIPAKMPKVPKPTPELGSVDNPGMFSKIPTTMPKVPPVSPPEPFAGGTPSRYSNGTPSAMLPPVPSSNGNGFHGNPTPFAGPTASSVLNPPSISLVNQFQAPVAAKPLILPADEPVKVGSEGRPASWTGEDVNRLSATGNRDAITQKALRGKPLGPNERYIMGDPDMARLIYNPREVTRFTPDGIPIRNSANPTLGTTGASPVLPPVPQSNTGVPAPSSITLTPPSSGGPSAPPQNFHDIPSQPVSPQEAIDLSRQLGRPVSPAEVNSIRRSQAAEQNIQAGLSGNRADVAGNIRELHRAKLEKPGLR